MIYITCIIDAENAHRVALTWNKNLFNGRAPKLRNFAIEICEKIGWFYDV